MDFISNTFEFFVQLVKVDKQFIQCYLHFTRREVPAGPNFLFFGENETNQDEQQPEHGPPSVSFLYFLLSVQLTIYERRLCSLSYRAIAPEPGADYLPGSLDRSDVQRSQGSSSR